MEGFCPLAFPCSGDIIVRTQTINPNETLKILKILILENKELC